MDLISREAALRTDCFGNGHEGLRAFHSYHDYRLMREYLESIPTIKAIPISFIENRITELAKERNKYEIGTSNFRYVDMKIYYYKMLLEDWEPTLTHMDGGIEDETD